MKVFALIAAVALCSPALADLAPVGPGVGGGASLTRLQELSDAMSAISTLKGNQAACPQQDYVYYASLNVPSTSQLNGTNHPTDLNFSSGDPQGGGGGSMDAGVVATGNSEGGGGTQVPAPAASVLALIGLGFVNWIRRRA